MLDEDIILLYRPIHQMFLQHCRVSDVIELIVIGYDQFFPLYEWHEKWAVFYYLVYNEVRNLMHIHKQLVQYLDNKQEHVIILQSIVSLFQVQRFDPRGSFLE